MGTKISSGRNSGIDFMKYICAFAVVYIHTSIGGEAYLLPLARFAVPVFFMVSGYFYSSVSQKGKEFAQIKKILLLILSANILFLGWNILLEIFNGRLLIDYLESLLRVRPWVECLLFNGAPLSDHLWYLNAFLYVLIAVYLADKFFGRKRLYKFIPLLLAVNLVLGNYSVLFLNREIATIYSRNFLFMGLPFFLLGDYFNQKQFRIKPWKLVVIMLLSILGTMVENALLMHFAPRINMDFYVSTLFLACSVFLLAVQGRSLGNSKLTVFVATVSRRTTSTVYIVHIIIDAFIYKFFTAIGVQSDFLLACIPLFVLVASTVFGFVCGVVSQKLKKMFTN